MIKKSIRICDVCSEEIPKRTMCRQVKLKLEVANLLFSRNPELTPTWTTLPDGNIQLDICLDCSLSMGKFLEDKKEN